MSRTGLIYALAAPPETLKPTLIAGFIRAISSVAVFMRPVLASPLRVTGNLLEKVGAIVDLRRLLTQEAICYLRRGTPLPHVSGGASSGRMGAEVISRLLLLKMHSL